MPRVHTILRLRKTRDLHPRRLRRLGVVGLVTLGGLLLALALPLIQSAQAAVALSDGLPAVENIALALSPQPGGSFQPIQIWDRSGTQLLLNGLHPAAEDRRWIRVDGNAITSGRVAFLLATLARSEPRFLDPSTTGPMDWLGGLTGATDSPSIAGRLAAANLQPLSDVSLPPWMQRLRRDYLAATLERRYSPEQLLEWHLNTADYGNFAYGIDAAALVYFGKHANELNLAESTVLAAIPDMPERNPIDSPQAARAAGQQGLRQLSVLGWIDPAQMQAAQRVPVSFTGEPARTAVVAPDIAWYALDQLRARFGNAALARGGLRVITTTDAELQRQAACALGTQLGRLGGEAPTYIEAADGGQACLAAGLLPAMRPGDIAVDHQIDSGTVIVVDPGRGEVLALAGGAAEATMGGRAIEPFIHLTALARGYTPATMLLDIAPVGADPPAEVEFHGPVRLRAALANAYEGASDYLLEHVGAQNVMRTIASMGIPLGGRELGGIEEIPAGPLALAQAYAVLSAEGRMVGEAAPADGRGESDGLHLSFLLAVEDPVQGTVYSYEPKSRAVLSPALAYLMIDILADDAARWPAFGRANSLEIDRPAAVTIGADRAGGNSWAFGFTPSRLVGVWMGNADGRPAQSADALNGAAPVWNAVMRYAHAALPRESWPRPPEVAQLDVCDPSGMLPTVYCPTVVRELFLLGTEPTHYDTLYQPYRINRETGKLATLFTPAKMVEERVFLVPPPEAAGWAEQAGIARPPGEYDTLIDLSPGSDGVRVTSPAPFDYVRGEVAVWGEADIPEMDFYRIQIGQGLNPSQWIQVAGDQTTAVQGGELGRWDTAGMDGLQALQLVVVAQDGTLRTASVPVTVDNAPPKIEFLSPLESGENMTTAPLLLEARVEDEVGVALVEFLVDGVVQASLKVAPFSARLERLAQGAHTLAVRATDLAGNQVTSRGIAINIGPG